MKCLEHIQYVYINYFALLFFFLLHVVWINDHLEGKFVNLQAHICHTDIRNRHINFHVALISMASWVVTLLIIIYMYDWEVQMFSTMLISEVDITYMYMYIFSLDTNYHPHYYFVIENNMIMYMQVSLPCWYSLGVGLNQHESRDRV